MSACWTIEDSNGQQLPHFACGSRIGVGLKVVPTRFDAFRLQVSSSYREMFDRALRQVLEREGWSIVQVKAPAHLRWSSSGSDRRKDPQP